MSAEIKLSRALQTIAAQLDEMLLKEAGERFAFVLVVTPSGRHGGSSYCSNVERDDGLLLLTSVTDHLKSGMPDIPLHESH